jgi:hypothetical protein
MLFGLGFIVCFVIGAVVLFVVVWSFLRKSKAATKIDSLTDRVAAVGTIDFSDGLDEREYQIIRDIFGKQKAEEAEAAVKERMLRAAKPAKP